mgnify:FL=1
MKKIGLLALALCAAGVAGAVATDWTYDWGDTTSVVVSGTNDQGDITGGTTTLPTQWVSSVGTVIYYGAIATGQGPSGDARRVVFGVGSADETSSISVNVGSDGELYLYQNGAGKGASYGTPVGTSLGSTTDAVLAANGDTNPTTAYLVLAIDRTNADGNATVTLYSSEADGSLNEVLIKVDNVAINGDLDTVYAADYYGEEGEGGGSLWGAGTSVQVYANLPEPTALALLALGVAGVALRRRVA